MTDEENAAPPQDVPGEGDSKRVELTESITKRYDLVDDSMPEVMQANADPSAPEVNPFSMDGGAENPPDSD